MTVKLPMDFKLNLNMDNAAFDEHVAEPLREIFGDIIALIAMGNQSGNAVDANGNTVGTWEITGSDERYE